MDVRTLTRWLGAASLVIGPAAIAAGTLFESNSDSAADELTWAEKHSTAIQVDSWIGLATLFMLPATLSLMRLARFRAPKLAVFGGSLTFAAWLAGLVAVAPQSTMIEYAAQLPDRSSAIGMTERLANDAPTGILTLVFVLGHLVGTLLLGIALVRARTVPRWAAVLVAVSPILHAGTFALSPLADAGAYFLLTISCTACAWSLVRTPNDAWDLPQVSARKGVTESLAVDRALV